MPGLQDYFTEHLGHPWEFVDPDASGNAERSTEGRAASSKETTVAELPTGDRTGLVVNLPSHVGEVELEELSLEEERSFEDTEAGETLGADLITMRASNDVATQTEEMTTQQEQPEVGITQTIPDAAPGIATTAPHITSLGEPVLPAAASPQPGNQTAPRPTGDIYTGPTPLTSLCPCTLIGHPCKHPERCQYQQTCWRTYCHCPLLHVKATCLSVREGFECQNPRIHGKPCWFGHEAEGEDGRGVQAGRHAGHHGARGGGRGGGGAERWGYARRRRDGGRGGM